MKLKTAAKKFRKWQADGMVIRDGDHFVHRTQVISSQVLFGGVVAELGGQIISRDGKSEAQDGRHYYLTTATLPPEALPLIEPRPRPGWPPDAPREGRPKLPEGESRVQQGARYDPATRPLAEAIAAKLGLKSWSWAVDEAVKRMAEEVGIKKSGIAKPPNGQPQNHITVKPPAKLE